MTAKRNARPAVGAAERAGGHETGRVASPHKNFITENGQTQGHIESLLVAAGAFGESNAISAAELRSMAGLSDCRVIRHEVHAERRAGALILSGDCGYYLPAPGAAGEAEIRAFVRRLESHAVHIHEATGPARKALSRVAGQLTLFGDGGVSTWKN